MKIFFNIKNTILFVFILTNLTFVKAQCDISDTTNPEIISYTKTVSTCTNNAVITITVDNSKGGGEFVYEIVSGPKLSPIQSQNVLKSLPPGLYTVRVTGCNGLYDEDTIRIEGTYDDFSPFVQGFGHLGGDLVIWENTISKDSNRLICGRNNDGMIVLMIGSVWTYAINEYRDKLRFPFYYQISSDLTPISGFNGVPKKLFTSDFIDSAYWDPMYISLGYHYKDYIDTIHNINEGSYQVRITDACDNYYDFPLDVYPASLNSDIFGYNVAMHTAESTSCGAPLKFYYLDTTLNTQISNAYDYQQNPAMVIIRKSSTMQIVDTCYMYSGSNDSYSPPYVVLMYNQKGKKLYFQYDTTYSFEVRDKCNRRKYFSYTMPATSPLSSIADARNCFFSGSPIYYKAINTNINNAEWKLYDITNNVLLANTFNSSEIFHSNGIFGNQYKIVYKDGCGWKDSITFTHSRIIPGTKTPTPTFTLSTSKNQCNTNKPEFVNLTRPSGYVYPIKSIWIDSGDVSMGPFPLNFKFSWPVYYSDSSVATGIYKIKYIYGCDEVDSFRITVTSSSSSYTSSFGYTKTTDACNGVKVVHNFSVTGVPPPIIRTIDTFPTVYKEKLKSQIISYRNYARSTGFTEFYYFNENDTNLNNFKFPIKFSFEKRGNYFVSMLKMTFRNPNNNTFYSAEIEILGQYGYGYEIWDSYKIENGFYKFSAYPNCSSYIKIDSDSFTILQHDISGPSIGRSVAYICDNGDRKLMISPGTGIRPFSFQIKHKDSLYADYSALQTDSVFILPNNVAGGEEYIVRIIDNCGRNINMYVPIQSYTGKVYINNNFNCDLDSVTLVSSALPKSTYTWKDPAYTNIPNNLNRATIQNFDKSDSGYYYVEVDALNGCINRTDSTFVRTRHCPEPLPLLNINFNVKNINNINVLTWQFQLFDYIKYYNIYRKTSLNNDFVLVSRVNITANNGDFFNFYDNISEFSDLEFADYYIEAIGENDKYFTQIERIYIKTNKFIVYPNPASNIIKIEHSFNINNYNFTFELFSSEMEILKTEKLTFNENTIDISEVKSGVYLYSIKDSKNTYWGKLIIQK